MTVILPSSQKPKIQKKLLMIESIGNGPWVPVANVISIIVNGAREDDVIEISRRGEDSFIQKDTFLIRGSGKHPIILPKGQIKVTRVEGRSPITVYAESK